MSPRIIGCALAAFVASGCATPETVTFQPIGEQQSIVRDGHRAVVSTGTNSIVLVRPAARTFERGTRPAFVVAVSNISTEPINFAVADIVVNQEVSGRTAKLLPVKTYEQLVKEEKRRQVAAAILTGLAAGANAMSASSAGYSTANANVYSTTATPYGTYNTASTMTATVYDPGRARAAQALAGAQNRAMMDEMVETGQRNLAALEQTVIKDNTMFPGEWYGGQLLFEPPDAVSGSSAKSYTMRIPVGPDVHEIRVTQAPQA